MKDNDRVRLGVALTIFGLIWSELHMTSSRTKAEKQSLISVIL